MAWYHKHKYVENPLEYDALKADDELINYDKELVKLLYWVESGSAIIIKGPSGSGKTRLAKEIIFRFRGKGKLVYIKGSKINKDFNVYNVLMKNQNFIKKFFGLIPKNIILIIDDAQSLTSRAYKKIQYFFDQDNILSVVFLTRNHKELEMPLSLQDRIGSKIIKTSPLTKRQAMMLVKERLYNPFLSEKNIRDVQKRSGDFQNFLNNLEIVAKYMVEKDLKSCNINTIKKALRRVHNDLV